MREIEEMSLKFGETSLAYMTKSMRFKFQFFRGERLSTLSQTFDTNLQTMASTRFQLVCVSSMYQSAYKHPFDVHNMHRPGLIVEV